MQLVAGGHELLVDGLGDAGPFGLDEGIESDAGEEHDEQGDEQELDPTSRAHRQLGSGGAYGSEVRVVLADNDADALELLELDLRLEGHEVVAAVPDGASAVDACEEHRPDVLVVDYRMPPGLDGVEVSRQVLAAGTCGRVIVCSNYRDPAVVARAVAAGAHWLRKGDLAALRRVVMAGHGHPGWEA